LRIQVNHSNHVQQVEIVNEEPQSNWLYRFIRSPLDEIADEQRRYLQSADRNSARKQAIVVFAVAALMLTMRDEAYRVQIEDLLLWSAANRKVLPSSLISAVDQLASAKNLQLSRLAIWSLWQFLTYALIPIAVIKFALRGNVREYGLKLNGVLSGCWIYLVMYLMILPVILLVSSSASFQHTYPFFKPDPISAELPSGYMPRFWIWQCFYALQFISLEFFFRGFMLHGMKRQLGAYSIFMMTIPYCMIHFGKPLPETLGAIIAGVVLGFMSLKTRSIWMGAALHIAVAMTMDFAALYQRL